MIQDDIARVLRANLTGSYAGFIDLDDIASEILLSYLRNGHLETYSPQALKTFAVRTARRMLGRIRAAQERAREWAPDPPRHRYPAQEVTAQLKETLDGMTAKVERIALLRHGAGMTWAEVGEALDCSGLTARLRWARWASV